MKEIEKLYDLYSKDVYRFIYSLSFDEEIAKDIMQITFLECIKSIKNFKGNCSEKTWLLSISKNQYYTYLKKHPKTQSIYESDFDEVEEFTQDDMYKYREILKVINSLKEPQRQIMILRLINDLTFKEIGKIWVKVRITVELIFLEKRKK